MRIALGLLAAALLVACGADGEPVTPSMNSSVTIGPGGVSTSASVGLSRGPFTLGMHL